LAKKTVFNVASKGTTSIKIVAKKMWNGVDDSVTFTTLHLTLCSWVTNRCEHICDRWTDVQNAVQNELCGRCFSQY